MSYELDGKGNVWSTSNNKIVWSGDPATVVKLLVTMDAMQHELAFLRADNGRLQRAVNDAQAENAELRQEIARLRGLVETGKQAAVQALTLYQENERLANELRKFNARA